VLTYVGRDLRRAVIPTAVVALAVLTFVFCPSARAAKLPYFSFGEVGQDAGQLAKAGSGNGLSPGPAAIGVNPTGIGQGVAPGDVYVVDRESSRIVQFHANGNFVRAFGEDVVRHGGEHDLPGPSEVQELTINMTEEGFTLLIVSPEGPLTSATLPFDATAGEVELALETFSNIGEGNVSVAGGPAGTAPFTITFGGELAGDDVPQVLVQKSPGGAAGSVAFSTTVPGGGNYEICEADSSPVDICKQGSASSKAGGLGLPQGIAVDKATGNVFVTDQTNRRVSVYSANGVFQGAFGWGVDTGAAGFEFCTTASGCQSPAAAGAAAGQFGTQIGYAAIDPTSGKLYVADKANRRVDRFSFTLNGSGEVTNAAFDLAFGWGVDTNIGAFEVCTTASTCNAGVTTSPGNPGQFAANQPVDVAVDSSGAVYAVESTALSANKRRVHKFTPQVGPPVFAPSAFDDTDLSSTSNVNAPQWVAIGPEDHVFVAKAFPLGTGAPPATVPERRVLELDASGAVLDTHLAGAGINLLNDIELDVGPGDTAGRLYAANAAQQRVDVFIDAFTEAPTATTGATTAGAEWYLRQLHGEVNPNGRHVASCHFEYGLTTEYGTVVPCDQSQASLGEGITATSVSAETEPLEPNTTYHYRLVASNVVGGSQGADQAFTTGPAVDSCSDATARERRLEQGIAALVLPDCMALEMVSPPEKAGHSAKFPNVSANGGRVSFVSTAALGDEPPGMLAITGATYVASRGDSDWTTEMTVPNVEPRFDKLWDDPSQQRPSFTPDFSRWLGMGATAAQVQQGIGRAYEAGLGGFFRPLSEPLVPLTSVTNDLFEIIRFSDFQGASADHSHLYFRPAGKATYLPGDSTSEAEPGNVYLARRGPSGELALELLQRDRTGKIWGGNCGARLGGIGSVPGIAVDRARNQGAVSADGTRTLFSAPSSQPSDGSCDPENKLRILERIETSSGPLVSPLFASECSRPSVPDPPGPCSSADGSDFYQGASVDQSKVYFATNRQLTDSDIDESSLECSAVAARPGCDLYLFDRARPAGDRLVQVSAGEDVAGEHERGKEARVFNGTTAISADGSHVYFVASGVLTDEASPAGETAKPGRPNLYLWTSESEEIAFLGRLHSGDRLSGDGLWGSQGTWRNNAYAVPATGKDADGAEIGGDGHILVFQTMAELKENDGDGSHLDVYRYDAEASTLACLSCAPGSSASEPDSGAFDVDGRNDPEPPGTDFAESRRWVSEDGEVLGFVTSQPLLAGDRNGVKDAYLWREGKLTRLPGVSFGGSRAFAVLVGPYLSHDGSTVAFVTSASLLPMDRDGTGDVYVARVGGGYVNPKPPILCEPGVSDNACQPSSPPPSPRQAASETLPPPSTVPGRRRCPKGKVRRKGRCVKKRHAHRQHHARHTNNDRRAGK
jgi:hypothetical protein